MGELILHHYEISPYAEKARVIFGLKGLRWRSVQIPIVMPKPDLTALTGGYRLTPTLQVGADIYCDTKCIARRLEEEKGEPTLYPQGAEAINRALASWGESMFMDLVAIGFATGVFDDDFVRDRQSLIPGGVNIDLLKAVAPSKIEELRSKITRIEEQLGDGRSFLLGDAPSLADLSVYHPLWAASGLAAGSAFFGTLQHVPAWMKRIAAFGHGERDEMESKDAVEIARTATPQTEPYVDPGDMNGRKVGDRVQMFPEAYGRDPVAGELVRADVHEVAIRRVDERAGEVVVHFPREGFILLPS